MIALVILLCQSLPVSLFDEPAAFDDPGELRTEALPGLADFQEQHRHPLQIRESVEAYAVYTVFQGSIRIDRGWGFGGDVKIIGDWGRRGCLVFRLGYAGWNTEVDHSSLAYPAMAQVRQYRIGVGVDFVGSKTEFGLSLNSGAYRFRTKHVPTDFVANDTTGFLEFEAVFGVKPVPWLKIGVVGMLTFTETDFNRPEGHGRMSANESIGPSLEMMFEF